MWSRTENEKGEKQTKEEGMQTWSEEEEGKGQKKAQSYIAIVECFFLQQYVLL